MDRLLTVHYEPQKDLFIAGYQNYKTLSSLDLRNSFAINVFFPSDMRFDISEDKVYLEFHSVSNHIIRINSAHKAFEIEIECYEDWRSFLLSKLEAFVGTIAGVHSVTQEEDLLWIEKAKNGQIWILVLVSEQGMWRGMLIKRNRLNALASHVYLQLDFKDFFLNPDEDIVAHLYGYLTDVEEGLALPPSFYLLKKDNINRFRNLNLTIKVHHEEMWFLLFPIDYFKRFERFGRFSKYEQIEWIVTSKSFYRNSIERLLIQRELSDLESFLKYSVVILNTYHHYFNEAPELAKQCKKETELVVDILNLLQDVEIVTNEGIINVSLRWFLNPTEEDLTKVLRDNRNKYIFADFHVENGVWQLGHDAGAGDGGSFAIDFLNEEDLKHVRLMRIFHCRSIFDPYSPEIMETSLTQKLLNAGAFRVEGSMLIEDYFDFLSTLLNMLFSREGLQDVLFAKCLEAGVDFRDLVSRVNDFLLPKSLSII